MSDPIEEALNRYASGKSFTESIEPLLAALAELKAALDSVSFPDRRWK